MWTFTAYVAVIALGAGATIWQPWSDEPSSTQELTAAEASAAKLWHTELQWEACDASLQLHGGAGYMNEYLIARLWRDARVTRIFGGTNEIMKEVVGRAI